MERILTSMADTMAGKIGDVCFDSAYLTRSICNLISNMGGTPFIKPKSNTTPKSLGSHSWKKMVTMYLKNLDKFNDHYHQQSIVESVFAALKELRGRGGSLRSRMDHTQDKELVIQTISYNIDMVARRNRKRQPHQRHARSDDGRITLQKRPPSSGGRLRITIWNAFTFVRFGVACRAFCYFC